jgi:glutamyl-tRNA synthetase
MNKISKIITQYALQNAVFYKGRADPAAVLGKVFASMPELRQRISVVSLDIDRIVRDVNRLGLERQKAMLREMSPGMVVKPEKKQAQLPELPRAVPGKFVTRFAPSPTGSLNLGQLLRAAMLPYLYSKKYDGQFILRIEDTDPGKIEKVYYGMIMEDLLSSGVKWDRMVKESDHMPLYYRHAWELISSGKAYVCTCPAENFRKLKVLKRNCGCRSRRNREDAWKKMLDGAYREGEAVVRLKTSMQDPNPTMRDPPLLRITSAAHPIQGG